MLKIDKLYKSYDGKFILENISAMFYKNEKVGLIGDNGVGKTTLIRMIKGEENPDRGVIKWEGRLKVSFMAQEINGEEKNIESILKTVQKDLIEKQQLDPALVNELKHLLGEFEQRKKDIAGMQKNLSGGEKTKLKLIEVLSQDADVFVLDEPTNHLDAESICRLINVVKGSRKTFIMISHDRYFLNETVEKIYELTPAKLSCYNGNYDSYREQKEHEVLSHEKAYHKQQKQVQHIEEAIASKKQMYHRAHKQAGQNDFYRSKAKKHVGVIKNLEKRLDKVQREGVDKLEDKVNPAFNRINEFMDQDKLPKILIRAENVTMKYDDATVLDQIELSIKRYQRIALLGANGSGKSTLLKIIVGDLAPTTGQVKMSHKVKIGYFSQELTNLNMENSIYDEVKVPYMEQGEIRKILANFLFRKDKVFTRLKELSMGEKCRVAFVKLLLQQNNVLVLDEMTNYMDITSKECLEQALTSYKGTVIFVSHDMYFIDKIATKVCVIKDRDVQQYNCSYREYLHQETSDKTGSSSSDERDSKGIERELMNLEIEQAYVNSVLCANNIAETERQDLETKFFDLTSRISLLKQALDVQV